MKSNCILLVLIVLGFSASAFTEQKADTVYINGKFYTVNEDQPWAQAVAIADKRFIKVGSNEDVEENIGDGTQVIDLEGKFVMPGVADTNIHPSLAYPSDEQGYPAGLSRAMKEMHAYGITAFIDMSAEERALEIYLRLEEEEKFNFQVAPSIALPHSTESTISASRSSELLKKKESYDTHLVHANSVNYWADGSLTDYKALLIEPYANKESRGELILSESQFDRLSTLDLDGLIIRFHSAGDGTTRKLLDAIKQLRADNPNNSAPHHIGRLMIVHPDDISRFVKLNVVAQFSPALWYPNSLWEETLPYVGEERMARWQPIKEFVEAGVTVSYGSDWPVGAPNADPWRALEAMVTREDPTGGMPGKIGKGIDVGEGIRILTMGGANAMDLGGDFGSMELVKYGDLIILDQNLFEIPPTDIHKTKVLSTIFKGKEVYKR